MKLGITTAAMLLLLLASTPALAGGFKIKVSKHGVQVGPVKVPAPPQVAVVTGIAKGESSEKIAKKVVQQQKASFAALTAVPQLQNALQNMATQQLSRVVGEEVTDVVETINFPTQVLRTAPGTALTVAENVLKGKSLDQILGMPVAAAIRQARDYYSNRAKPLPQEIQMLLAASFSQQVLRHARFVVDNFGPNLPGAINELQESFGNGHAVVVDNIIVFSKMPSPENIFWWAHEMQHVAQYKDLGIEGFAGKYVSGGWKKLEAEANAKGKKAEASAAQVVAWLNAVEKLHPSKN